jgi:hypothetical protein
LGGDILTIYSSIAGSGIVVGWGYGLCIADGDLWRVTEKIIDVFME